MVTLRLATAPLPPGLRIYAIGDIHGRSDLLDAVHATIAADIAARPVEAAHVIHLGDYIDRGPDSAGVIARLADGAPLLRGRAARVVNLMGNHEAMMLQAVVTSDDAAAGQWLRNGGIASLQSWGVRDLAEPATWRAAIPPRHLTFVANMAATHSAGAYLFVHAGVRPGVPLEQQSIEDLLWIREPFLSWPHSFGPMVVHGHTPGIDPVIRANRIGIDTAAAMGGVLTCAVLEEDTVTLIQRG